MRVLFSTDQVYLHGGIEKVMASKANYFVEGLGYEVVILTTEQKGKSPCYPLHSKIQLVDINVNYQREKSYFHPLNIKKIFFHFRQWKKAVQSIDPDVIIVCNYAFDFYWVPFFSGKRKTIKEYHSSRYYSFLQRKKGGFLQKIKFSLADYFESKYSKIVVLNKDEKPFYKNPNSVVIPNPIHESHLSAAVTNKKAIAAGRIAPIKGFENLIKTWRLVANRHSEWIIDIYGQGEEDYIEQLRSIIHQNHLENHVFFKTATNDLLNTMNDYSMYVMTSHSECFPMVLLESLSVGLPVVSFDCPTGPANIVSNGEDGILTENQNTSELANAIISLIENGNARKQMGVQAKANVSRFNFQTVMKQWSALFAEK